MAWTCLLLPWFVTHEVIKAGFVYRPFLRMLWISDFCHCSTLRMHTSQDLAEQKSGNSISHFNDF